MDYRDAKICGNTLDGKPCGWIYQSPRCPRCAGNEAVLIRDLMFHFLAVINELDSQTPRRPKETLEDKIRPYGPLKPVTRSLSSTPNPRT